MRTTLISILGFLFFLMGHIQCQEKSDLSQQDWLLHHLVRQPDQINSQTPTLVLLHGYGSNEQDLFAFAKAIPRDWLVVSARGPYTMSVNQFKWYDLDFSSRGPISNFEQSETSRKLIVKFIEQVALKYKVPEDKIVLGGFSQGAIMSFSVGLMHPEKVKGIACFSGRILKEIPKMTTRSKALSNLRVLVTHGQNDKVLLFTHAQESKAILERLDVNLSFHQDNSGHTISRAHFAHFLNWLKNL